LGFNIFGARRRAPKCEWQENLNLNTILRVNHPHHLPPTSPLHLESLNAESEVAGATATATNPDISEQSTIEPPEVEYLIHKLHGFSISPKKSDKSQGSVTSQYNPAHPLTRLKSEKFAVQPTELPLPTRKRARKSPKGSDSETLSSLSSISTSSPRSQPSTPSLQVIVHQPTGTSITPQPSGVVISSSSQPQGSSSALSSVSSSAMAHPEKWLPKFNLEAGMLAEEHINNFMLSINLNGFTNEDVVVRIFSLYSARKSQIMVFLITIWIYY